MTVLAPDDFFPDEDDEVSEDGEDSAAGDWPLELVVLLVDCEPDEGELLLLLLVPPHAATTRLIAASPARQAPFLVDNGSPFVDRQPLTSRNAGVIGLSSASLLPGTGRAAALDVARRDRPLRKP